MIIMSIGRPAHKPRTDFGKRLALIREQKGISQVELAERMGVTQSAVAHWERRSMTLTPDQVVRLARALDVSFDELFGEATTSRRKNGPSGKVHQCFEAVSRLPRRQQEKVVEFVEAFVEKKTAIS